MFSDIRQLAYLFVLFLLISCGSDPEKEYEAHQYVIDSSIEADSGIVRTIAPYKEELDSNMKVRIGSSAEELHTGEPEGKLGNFTAELVLERSARWAEENGETKPHMALLNNGGLRVPLPKGTLQKGDIYRLMPFENVVELLELEGSTMKELFRYLSETPQPIAGGSLRYDEEGIVEARVQGEPLETDATYRVATTDFLAEGGDGMDFFKEAERRISTGVKLRDMIIAHIRELDEKGEAVKAKEDGRIQKAGTMP